MSFNLSGMSSSEIMKQMDEHRDEFNKWMKARESQVPAPAQAEQAFNAPSLRSNRANDFEERFSKSQLNNNNIYNNYATQPMASSAAPEIVTNNIKCDVYLTLMDETIIEEVNLASNADHYSNIKNVVVNAFNLNENSFILQFQGNGHTYRVTKNDQFVKCLKMAQSSKRASFKVIKIEQQHQHHSLQQQYFSTDDPLPMARGVTPNAPTEYMEGKNYESPVLQSSYPVLPQQKLHQTIARLEQRIAQLEKKFEYKVYNGRVFDVKKEYRVRLKNGRGYINVEQVTPTELYFNVSTFNHFYGCIQNTCLSKWHYRVKGNCQQRAGNQEWDVDQIEHRG